MGGLSQRDDIADLLDTSGRIVTLAGVYGCGKSSLAVAAAKQLQKKFVLPLWFDLLGCVSAHSVFRRLQEPFGLHFRLRESQLFYNWLNAHEQRLLFVLDNVDQTRDQDSALSDLLDDLVTNVKNIRILCTSRRHFYQGQATHELYRVGRLEPEAAVDLVKAVSPDLHEEGMDGLVDAACQNPFLIKVITQTCMMDGVDSGKLFEEVTDMSSHDLLYRVEEQLDDMTENDSDTPCLIQMANCLLKVLDNIPLTHTEALVSGSYFAGSFDAAMLAILIEGGEESAVSEILIQLVAVGLLILIQGDSPRYRLPALVRLVAQSKAAGDGEAAEQYCRHMVENLKLACANYLSRQCESATKLVHDNYDNILQVLGRVVEREDAYDYCPTFPTLEFAFFLSEVLPADVYVNMYEQLAAQAADKGDVGKQCRALCCLVHMYDVEGDRQTARQVAEKAYDLVHNHSAVVEDTDKAFCLKCLGKVYWEDGDRLKATSLVKTALDIYKIVMGSRHLQTLFTNELYAWMLTSRGNHQSARHFYNISDLFLKEQIDDHPLFVEGYDCRRAIWDSLSLFQRAIDMSKKAATVCQGYYGEHPLTARMMANWCDCITKRGSLHDAISAGIKALAIRVKVLGDHVDTGLSYKSLAYLMLRSGQYDEATRFGQSALDIYEKMDAPERLKIDVRNVMAQARYRLDCKSSVYVQIQGKNASKRSSSRSRDLLLPRPAKESVSTEV